MKINYTSNAAITLLIITACFFPAKAQQYLPDSLFGALGEVITPQRGDRSSGNSILLQPDGRLIVSGEKHIPNAVLDINAFLIYRLMPDGQLDHSFGDSGRAELKFHRFSSDKVLTSGLQPDGTIIVAGVANNNFAMARYSGNGTIDSSFGVSGMVETNISSEDEARAMLLLPDGSIFIGGSVFHDNFDFAILKYQLNGSPDPSFGNGGVAITDLRGVPNGTSYDQLYGMAIQPDGKIVASGYSWDNASGYDFSLVRYNTNGSLDASFGANGMVRIDFGTIYDYGYNVHIKSNGNILITGCTPAGDGTYKFAAAEVLSSGALNPAFGNNGVIIARSNQKDNWFSRSIQMPDGNILLAGHSVNSIYSRSGVILKLGANGQFDTAFNSSGSLSHAASPYFSFLNDLLLQPDGKLVICGSTDATNDTRFNITRFKTYTATHATGIEVYTPGSFALYPNPTAGHVYFDGENTRDYSVAVYNIAGEMLLQKEDAATLDLSEYAPGIYVVKCTHLRSGALTVTRVIKH